MNDLRQDHVDGADSMFGIPLETPALVPVTTAEAIALHRESGPRNPLSLSISPGRIAIPAEHARWAVARLDAMRKAAQSSGDAA